MIDRFCKAKVEAGLARQAAVAIIGPRQVGKTTLARQLGEARSALYLDLESPRDRRKLAEPELFLATHADKLVILDEIHRVPELFQPLRGIIDDRRRMGQGVGQFLLLGSAAIDLLRQTGESLAGRVEFVDLTPVHALEYGSTVAELQRLWLRGGFPNSLLATDDHDSLRLREDFIRTYLERDVATFAPRMPAETLERLWTMLAHNQGQLLNASRLASGLGVTSPTVSRYVDLLCDLLLVRRLTPYVANLGKRLVKSPKVFVRDSGLLHALLGLESYDDLLGSPIVGSSWEGFVIESLLAVAPHRTRASHYRTSGGAELDLILEMGGKGGTWVVEVKHSLTPKLTRGFHEAIKDVQPDQSFVVYPGDDSYPLGESVTAVSLPCLMSKLAEL